MAGQWQTVTVKAGFDAYVDWLRGPGGKYPPPFVEHSLAVCLKPGVTLREFRGRYEELGRRLPNIAFPLLCGLEDDLEHFTITAPRDIVSMFHEESALRECIHRILSAQKLPDDAVCRDPPSPARRAVAHSWKDALRQGKDRRRAQGTVVIGVIEEGVALANQRFRRGPCDSRVEYAWLQDARCVGYVEGFGYGRELRKRDAKEPGGRIIDKGIDSLLRECIRGGQVNEDLFYAAGGLADFGRPGHKAVALRASHGALVMDLACGHDQGTSPVGKDGLDQRPIVCVQLPTVTVADTSGLGLERYMLDGLNYILDRADRLAGARGWDPLPVVVNFSSGVLAGPHDGTHPIEVAIDQAIRKRRVNAPTEVILPTGNSYLARIHASVLVPAEGQVKLPLRVLPDDKTCTYVELWLPQPTAGASEAGLELMVEPPGGERSPALSDARSKRALVWRPNGRDAISHVYYEYFGAPTNRGRYLFALLPTACHKAPTQLAPCGTWSFILRSRTGRPIDSVKAWVQWDDRPLGFPRTGRQAYFDDPGYQRFEKISGREVVEDNKESFTKRAGTLSAIATGADTVVVGALKQRELTVSSYSGAASQQANGAGRSGPDAVVASDDSSIHQGIAAAGTRSRSMVFPNGTSVAAPQIARFIAERLAKGDHRKGCKIVKALALKQERDRPAAPPLSKRERGGWGRIVLPRNTSRVGRQRIIAT